MESLISRTSPTADQRVHDIPVGDIAPNPRQPRQVINEATLDGLAQSIKAHGVLQPVVVRRLAAGYELVAGERRLRASRLAGRATIPALIIEATEDQSLELALIENIQRENLSPLEEAEAFQEILTATAMTQSDLSERLGRSRAAVANSLRLLDLPGEVKDLLRAGALSAGQAKAILAARSSIDMVTLATEAVAHSWSVRELERQVKRLPRSKGRPARSDRKTGLALGAKYQEQLRIIYGTKVSLEGTGDRGRIAFEFYSAADLTRLLGMLLEGGLALEDQARRTGDTA